MCGTTLDTMDVVTRKPHRCHGCAYRFPAKTPMRAVVSADEGSVGTAYFCGVCQLVMKHDREYLDGEDCIEFGMLHDSYEWPEFYTMYHYNRDLEVAFSE